MKCEVPLTPEQCLFASEHHSLVYKFLNENHLPIDEFYDVVIFGYLRAVSRYFNSRNCSSIHLPRLHGAECQHVYPSTEESKDALNITPMLSAYISSQAKTAYLWKKP